MSQREIPWLAVGGLSMCACSVASSGITNCQKRESAIRAKSRKSFVALGVIGRSYLLGMGSNPTRPTIAQVRRTLEVQYPGRRF